MRHQGQALDGALIVRHQGQALDGALTVRRQGQALDGALTVRRRGYATGGLMNRHLLTLVAVLLLGALPVGAQEDLAPLWQMPFDAAGASDIEARSLQLYRIPVSIPLLDTEERAWGLDLTLPLTLGGYDVSAVLVDDLFSDRIETYSLVPGIEFLVPVGPHWMIKPFAELGVTGSENGTSDLLWGVGTRARAGYAARGTTYTLGGAAEYRAGGGARSLVEHYSLLGVVAAAQARLPFTVAGRSARAGLFAGYRFLTDATLRTLDADDLEIRHQVEAGVSFSTTPALKLWFISVPWIGVAYRAAGALSGVRIYLAFPF